MSSFLHQCLTRIYKTSRLAILSCWMDLPNERVLGEQLRQEADAERPQFSTDLHQQLCRAVQHVAPCTTMESSIFRRHAAKPRVNFSRGSLSNRSRIVWGGLAIVGVLFLVGWNVSKDVWWSSMTVHEPIAAGRTGEPTTSLATLAMLPDRATVRVEQWVVTAMTASQWAYLEHDARLVADWLVEELPWNISG